MSSKISVVIPAHNEEENIKKIITNVIHIVKPFEVLVIDDCSSDKTSKIVKNMAEKNAPIRLIKRRGDPGFGKALKTGFRKARGDFIIPVMADSCDNLEDIKKMIEKSRKGYDIVCGSRYIKGGGLKNYEGLKSIFSKLFCIVFVFLTGIKTHDVTNSFKLYKSDIFKKIKIVSDGFDISVEITLKAYSKGFKITEIPTLWKKREKGKSKFRVFHFGIYYVRWLLLGIYYRFKNTALRFLNI